MSAQHLQRSAIYLIPPMIFTVHNHKRPRLIVHIDKFRGSFGLLTKKRFFFPISPKLPVYTTLQPYQQIYYVVPTQCQIMFLLFLRTLLWLFIYRVMQILNQQPPGFLV